MDTLDDDIRTDLAVARADLLAARAAQRAKDTPATRRRVEECVARIDRLLDAWNAVPVLALTPGGR